ncbi:LysM peptidoglycan-binding domain-containing protein [Kiritimatiellaeota bacterium B1221]|nr:LysM peptidoglycan-binding domain-containing protein [Kiritimatiellaeota bacterium B1221]
MKVSTAVILVGLLGLSGCQTRTNTSEQLAQQRAIQERQRQQQLAEQRQRVQMQLEDTDARLTESQQQVQQLRAELSSRPTHADIQTLENRIAALEQMIQRMEIQRAKDREEIVEILSQRMASVLSKQQATQAASSGRTHVVASGETLSAIAQAWRVSSQSIIQANNLRNPNNLRIGQKLIIPGS